MMGQESFDFIVQGCEGMGLDAIWAFFEKPFGTKSLSLPYESFVDRREAFLWVLRMLLEDGRINLIQLNTNVPMPGGINEQIEVLRKAFPKDDFEIDSGLWFLKEICPVALAWQHVFDDFYGSIPAEIEVINEGKTVVCKDTAGHALWYANHPTIQEWREHRNYGNGRYAGKDFDDGVFWGGCIKDGQAIITFALRSQLMVNINYDAMTGELRDIHEAR